MKKLLLFICLSFLFLKTSKANQNEPQLSLYSSVDSSFSDLNEIIFQKREYLIQTGVLQKDLYLFLKKIDKGTERKFKVEYLNTSNIILYGENKNKIESTDTISFKDTYKLHYKLNSPIQNEFVLAITAIDSSKIGYKIRIRGIPKLIIREEIYKDTKNTSEKIYNDTTKKISLDSIKKGDTLLLKWHIGLAFSIEDSCNIESIIDFPGSKVEENKKISILDSGVIHQQVIFREIGNRQGKLTFKHSFKKVAGEPLVLDYNYNVYPYKNYKTLFMEFMPFILSFILTCLLTFLGSKYIKYKKKKYVSEVLTDRISQKETINNELAEILTNYDESLLQSFSSQLVSFIPEASSKTTENKTKKRKESKKNQENKSENKDEEETTQENKSTIENIFIATTLTKIKENFIDELIQDEKITNCSQVKIKSLKDKWMKNQSSFSKDNLNRKQLLNKAKYDAIEKELAEERKAKHILIKQNDEKLLEKEIETERERELAKSLQKEVDKLTPYPSYMKRYFDLTGEIYEFALKYHNQSSKDSMSSPILEAILFVKGGSKTINPMFNQVRKDDYLLEILKLEKVEDLKHITAATFFDFMIKGRGFNILNAICKLYLYSITIDGKLNIKGKLEEEGIELSHLELLYEEIKDLLKSEFQVELLFPNLLIEKYDKNNFDKTHFSYLSKYFSFTEVEYKIIYDMERIGFKAMNNQSEIIQRPLVTYKSS